MFDPGVTEVPATEAHSAVTAAFALPSGSLIWLGQQAQKFGVSLWALLVWLGAHPTELSKLVVDLVAKNFAKAAADLLADWRASQGATTP